MDVFDKAKRSDIMRKVKSKINKSTEQNLIQIWAFCYHTAAIMGRMHAPGKDLSQSALPYRRSVPTWLKLTCDDVKEQIYKLAKKGLTPSQIGESVCLM